MDQVRRLLHADEAHAAGYTGRGITAAVLDSGICLHPDYAGRIAAFRDFVNGRRLCYDDASHGSHVSGILGGDGRSSNGRYCGIAPGCRLIHLKVLDRYGQGSPTQIIRAAHWVIRNREAYGIRILNLSAGTAEQEDDAEAAQLVQAMEAVWDAGIAVVCAAGNFGPDEQTVTVPGSSKKVITVGAYGGRTQVVPCMSDAYSGCGPTAACVCKPELVAPGTGICACSSYWKQGRYYSIKSGTSMAAPAVAGCIALLLEKEPELSCVAVKMRLKEAARDLGCPRNRQGWGMLDLRKLLAIS